MTESTKKEIKILFEQLSVKQRRFFTALIWFFIACSYLSFGFYDELPLLFYLTLLPLIAAGLKEPALFKKLLFPTSMRQRLIDTKIFTACKGPEQTGETDKKRSLKQQLTGALLLSTLFPIIIISSLSNVFYTPILNLNEMDIYEGQVAKAIYTTGRRGRGPILWLETSIGKTIKFYNVGTKADIDYLKKLGSNETIKIWAQDIWNLTGPEIRGRKLWQLQHGDIFLKRYNKAVVIHNTDKIKKTVYLLLSYVITALGILWVIGNKYSKSNQSAGEPPPVYPIKCSHVKQCV